MYTNNFEKQRKLGKQLKKDTYDFLKAFSNEMKLKALLLKSPKLQRVLGLHIRDTILYVCICKCVNYISNTMIATKKFFI